MRKYKEGNETKLKKMGERREKYKRGEKKARAKRA